MPARRRVLHLNAGAAWEGDASRRAACNLAYHTCTHRAWAWLDTASKATPMPSAQHPPISYSMSTPSVAKKAHLLEHGVVPLAQAVGARRLLAEGVAVQDVVVALRSEVKGRGSWVQSCVRGGWESGGR